MRARRSTLTLAATLSFVFLFHATAPAQETVDIKGVKAALLKPKREPVGSLVLLAGGDGEIGVGAKGKIEREGNQLVRTRQAYVAKGFAVLVPDADVDVVAAVDYMANIRKPVTLVGTSRGTQRAAVGLAAGANPDALVVTSGFLSPQSGERVNRHVIRIVGSPARLPRTLVIHHRRDACQYTLPAGVQPFLDWSQGRARVIWLDGGRSEGDPCRARAYHGFNGIDAKVVDAVTAFANEK